MKKILSISLVVFFLSQSLKAQFPYASIWSGYPPSYNIGTGMATSITPGYLWFGYMSTVQNIPGTWHANKNFCAMGYGASTFYAAYKLYDGFADCKDTMAQILNGYGISAIETNGTNYARYAITGTYDKGVWFTSLDSVGNILVTQMYPFPHITGPGYANPSQPKIIECPGTQEFYICGSFESQMYLIKISYTGAIVWSSFYSLDSEIYPKDLIVTGNSPSNLVVVGRAVSSTGNSDGFIMELSGSSGAVNYSKLYGDPTAYDEFNSITSGAYINTANANGYVIGGYTQSMNPAGNPWALKMNTAGNLIWSKLLQPSVGTNTGIIDILERPNTSSGYEYFAVLPSSAGMQVLRLDAAGSPYPYSSPGALYNEYIYDIPATAASVPNCISYVNGPVGNPYLGIQVYGTTNNIIGLKSSYVVSAYFNGEINCTRTLTTISNEYQGPAEETPASITRFGSFNICPNFLVVAYFPGATINFPCSGMILNGNNQRMGSATGIVNNGVKVNNTQVYPNPVSDKATISYSSGDHKKVSIELISMMGERITAIQTEVSSAGDYEESIDFKALNLESGIYFINTRVGDHSSKQKVTYIKAN